MSSVRALFLIFATPALSACLIVPTPGLRVTDHRYNTSPVRNITLEVGTTTREDVLLALGEPDWSTPYSGAILYVGAFIDALIILAGQGGGLVIPVGHHTELLLEFSEDGRIKRVSRDSRAVPLGVKAQN